MNYKEKYEQALERAKLSRLQLLDIGEEATEIEHIFPELAESEDERIVKCLLNYFHHVRYNGLDLKGTDVDEVLAWLEKQGSKKLVDDLTQQEAMDIAVAKCFEQGEQKPTDKVEPKFKPGDWITFYGGEPFKVLRIEAENNGILDYLLLNQNGHESFYNKKYVDENARLWTIKDAKDGDVLTLNNEYFLFKSKKKSATGVYISHCFVDSANTFREGGEFLSMERGVKIHPSTKEQRETLERAITNAGYRWDSDKKQLGRIIDEKQIKKNLQDNSFRRMFEQKPTNWSEEDEEIIQIIKRQLGGTIGGITFPMTRWLNSLKDRIK